MSTPTDPYSRPDHEDGHDDILDPLPEERDEHIVPEPDQREEAAFTDPDPVSDVPPAGDEPFTGPADEPAADPVAEPVPAADQRDDSLPSVDSETESTRAWTPDFSSHEDEKETEKAASEPSERERWEAAFGSAGTADDATVVKETSSADETRVATPVPAPPAATASGTPSGAYPTRTSVFNRGSADTAAGPYVSTPPESTQPGAVPVQPQFDHRYEEPIPEAPRGRGWAHAGVFFATLILAPLAWYLVADSGVRLAGLEGSAWVTGTVDWIVVLELLGALLCLGVLWFLAGFSSVGAIVFGAILAIAGAVAVFAPALAQDVLQSSTMQQFAGLNDFTGNVGHHLTSDLATGRLTVYGFLLLMTGVVSHNARRQGAERGGIIAKRDLLLSRKSDS